MSNQSNVSLQAVQGDIHQQPWHEVIPGLQVKPLVIDESRHHIEFLMKASNNWHPGRHRHTCETSLIVLSGGIANIGTGQSYSEGSFFYQEAGNTHIEEMFADGITAYVCMRGTGDTLVEFLNNKNEVQATMNVSHFSKLMSA